MIYQTNFGIDRFDDAYASFTVLSIACTGLLLSPMIGSDAVEKTCNLHAQRGQTLWTAARRARIRDNFQAAQVPGASSLFESIDRKLLTFVDEWQSSYQTACTATPAQSHDSTWETRQQPCFEKSLRGAEAFIQLLLKGHDSTTQHALDGVMSQTSPNSCRYANESDEIPKIPNDPSSLHPSK